MSMVRQSRRIKFSLARSWRRITILLILLVVLLIIAKNLPSATPGLDPIGKDATQPMVKHAPSGTSAAENNHYMLPDETGPKLDESLQTIPEKFTGAEKCPACLGKDMCDAMKEGVLRITFPDLPNIAAEQGIYYGKWHEKQVVVKKVGVEENQWQNFEKYICENVTKSKTCDISDKIVKSFAVKTGAFEPEHVQDAYMVAHKEPSDLQFAECVSEPLMDAVKDGAGLTAEWALDKAAMLYTSIVVSQEVLMLKSASIFSKPRPFPSLIGTCGQLLVLDHHGVPLETYVNANWDKRSGLALQLLNIIDLFANGDVTWYVLYTDFRYENFDVTGDERVVLMDLESIIVIDKESIAEYDDLTSEEPCNEPCFHGFLSELTEGAYPERHKICARAPHVTTDAMYAYLCKHILSDLAEHQDADDEEADEGATSRPRGLLHTPPSQHQKDITELLMECVMEAVAGSRLQAVEDLTEILQQYAGVVKRDDKEDDRQ